MKMYALNKFFPKQHIERGIFCLIQWFLLSVTLRKKKWSQNGSTPGAVSWYVTQLHPWHYLRKKNGSTLQSGIVFQNSSKMGPIWLHFFLSEQVAIWNFVPNKLQWDFVWGVAQGGYGLAYVGTCGFSRH